MRLLSGQRDASGDTGSNHRDLSNGARGPPPPPPPVPDAGVGVGDGVGVLASASTSRATANAAPSNPDQLRTTQFG